MSPTKGTKLLVVLRFSITVVMYLLDKMTRKELLHVRLTEHENNVD